MHKLLLSLVSFSALMLACSPARAVVEASPRYCNNQEGTGLEICGMAVWPSLPKFSWVEDNWLFSHRIGENVKNIKGSNKGVIYSDIYGSGKHSTTTTSLKVLDGLKKEYAPKFPGGTWSLYNMPVKSADGYSYKIYKFRANDEDKDFVDVMAFLEAPVVPVGSDSLKKFFKSKTKAVYVVGMTNMSNIEFEANVDKFKELLQTFSTKAPAEEADNHVIDAVAEYVKKSRNSCVKPEDESI